jgi:hypothetical protein
MTNQGTTAEPEKVEQPTGEQPDVAKNTETQPGPIPYERFKEVNEQFKLAKQQLDDLLADKQKREKETKEAEEKRLESQKEFEQLATERKLELEQAHSTIGNVQEQLTRQTAVLESLYEARKTAVPEMFQPLLDKLDLVDRLQWIADNEAKLKPVNGANGIPSTPTPKGMGELSPDQKRARAKRTW